MQGTAFFDGAGAGEHLAVLLAWIGVGFLAMLAAVARRRQHAPQVTQEVTVQ
jgi:hypothetical protein